jgi:hypothetical protein
MIGVFSAFKIGLANVWKIKKVLFWLYGINLIFAYFLAMPVSMMLADGLAKTTAADQLLQAFDYPLYLSLINIFGEGLNLSRMLISFGILYLILNIFLSGGILSALTSNDNHTISTFFAACSLYFKRFFKLFLISFLFCIMAFAFYLLISKLFALITADVTTEHLPLLLFVVKILLAIAMLAIINMLFDYVKIMTVVNDYYKMMEAVKIGMMFVIMRFIKTVGLYMLYLLTAVLLFLIFWIVESMFKITNGMMVFIFFIWTQLYMFLRLWVRLSFFAGQYEFYRYANSDSGNE